MRLSSVAPASDEAPSPSEPEAVFPTSTPPSRRGHPRIERRAGLAQHQAGGRSDEEAADLGRDRGGDLLLERAVEAGEVVASPRLQHGVVDPLEHARADLRVREQRADVEQRVLAVARERAVQLH